MTNKEAIEILEDMNDGYTFTSCKTCIADNKYNEEKGICESTSCDYLQAINQAIEALKENESLKEENDELTSIAIMTAFDDMNYDTEGLCRKLLKYNKIKLENGFYVRDDKEWEDNMHVCGFDKNKEKTFCIDDDKIDEYTSTLEKMLENSISLYEIEQIEINNKFAREDKDAFCWGELKELIDKKKGKGNK